MMRAVQRAQNFRSGSPSASRIPGIYLPPYGGSAYFGRAYRWRQVMAYRYWLFVGLKPWVREVAYGEPINLGRVTPKERPEKKTVRRKALSGPREHEEYTALEDGDPILELFRCPNQLDTAEEFWAYHILFYFMTGEAHWWIRRNGFVGKAADGKTRGVPREMWIIPTHWMQLQMGHDGAPSHYLVQSPWGHNIEIPFDDILSFREPSLLNRWEGTGVTQAISEWLDVYESMVRVWLATMKNGANPAYHISLGDRYGDPDDAFLMRFYAKLYERFQGEDRAGQPLVTGGDVEVKQIGLSPADIQFAQGEEKIRDNILTALSVSKTVLGIEPTSDLSSYAPLRQFHQAVNPEKRKIARRITEFLIRTTPGYENGIAFFDESMMDEPQQKLLEIESRRLGGTITPNEERALWGVEPYPHGGDNPWLNNVEMPWVTGDRDEALQSAILSAASKRGEDAISGTQETNGTPEPPLAPETVKRLMESMKPGGEIHRAMSLPDGADAELEQAFNRALGTGDGASGGFAVPIQNGDSEVHKSNGHVEEKSQMDQLLDERKELMAAITKTATTPPPSVQTPNITIQPHIYLPAPPAAQIQTPVTVNAPVTVEPTPVTVQNIVEPTPMNVNVGPTPVTVVNKNELTSPLPEVVVKNIVEAPQVDVHVPQQAAPSVTVQVPEPKRTVKHAHKEGFNDWTITEE